MLQAGLYCISCNQKVYIVDYHDNNMILLNCYKCGYEWIPRKEINPRCCPACHSRNWENEDYTKCPICKRNFLILEIHHKDRNHDNNKKENLIRICKGCHDKIHSGNRFKSKKDYAKKIIKKEVRASV